MTIVYGYNLWRSTHLRITPHRQFNLHNIAMWKPAAYGMTTTRSATRDGKKFQVGRFTEQGTAELTAARHMDFCNKLH